MPEDYRLIEVVLGRVVEDGKSKTYVASRGGRKLMKKDDELITYLPRGGYEVV